jgi:hypothetical protein
MAAGTDTLEVFSVNPVIRASHLPAMACVMDVN